MAAVLKLVATTLAYWRSKLVGYWRRLRKEERRDRMVHHARREHTDGGKRCRLHGSLRPTSADRSDWRGAAHQGNWRLWSSAGRASSRSRPTLPCTALSPSPSTPWSLHLPYTLWTLSRMILLCTWRGRDEAQHPDATTNPLGAIVVHPIKRESIPGRLTGKQSEE